MGIYSLRWKIETNGNRELKQGWYLNNFPSRSWNGISAHIFLTLFMFNVITAFKGSQGRSLTEKGIISLRHKYFKPFPHRHTITVYADDCLATFCFKELLEITGLPPPTGKLQGRGPTWVKYPNGKKELWFL